MTYSSCDGRGTLEQLGHHTLRQPDTLARKSAFDTRLPIFSLIEQEFAVRRLFSGEILATHALASVAVQSAREGRGHRGPSRRQFGGPPESSR